MVFFEALQALLNIDIQFFIDITLNNLVWVAIFYALIHYFFDGKKVWYWFLFWSVLLWAILDWEKLTGYVFTGAAFLLLYYITKISLLALAENSPGLRKYLVVISTIQAYSLIIIFTFFMKG